MLTLETLVERQFEQDGCDISTVAVRDVEGTMPAFRDGTWYLNGPGRFRNGALPYRHWLDGDGLIRAITFTKGDVTFASRFVRTRKFIAEQTAGQPLFRTFGTAFEGSRLNDRGTGLESPANINILPYAGRLLAFGEQGEPWEIDSDTLETRGPFTAGGALTAVTPFGAHPKVDPSSGELFNFGISFSASHPTINVFRWSADGRQLWRSRIALDYSCTLHDFALGPTTAVFYLSPYILDISALRDGASVMQSLEWRPELGSQLLVVSRETGRQLASIAIGNQYCLHTINCHETSDAIVVDVIEMPSPVYDAYTVPALFETPLEAHPVRLVIDVASGTLVSREVLVGDGAPEFPAIDPADCQRVAPWFWALGFSDQGRHGQKFFDRVMRVSWRDRQSRDWYQAPPGVVYGGEPTVLHDEQDERRRWVLCQLLDLRSMRAGAAVFDAFAIGQGPIARLWWPSMTPMAFHTTFVPRAPQAPRC
jgi:carotenoid cleavage dioxygenase-like enzyme